jgi:hypothetical protein
MELLGADFIGPLPETLSGYRWLLVLVEHYSKFCFLYPTVNARSSVLCAIVNDFFCTFGAPERILTDNGPQFVSGKFSTLLSEWAVLHSTITPNRPQGNFVERTNRNLKSMLSCFHHENHSLWADQVKEFQFALNSVFSDATGFSPARVFLGRELDGPGDRNVIQLPRRSVTPALDQKMAATKLKQAEANKRAYDQARADISFQEGQLVLIRSYFLSNSAKKFSKKLAPKWKGPFRVHKRLSALTYLVHKVDAQPSDRSLIIMHVDQMKEFSK